MTGPGKRAGVIVAIDGAAGSGKSTLARSLAVALGVPYLNTGLMYRSLAAAALDAGADPGDEAGLVALAGDLTFSFGGEGPPTLRVDGREPGQDLVAPEVEETVSDVSSHPGVRAVMVAEQRRLGAGGGVIEGRDIGSVVFPDARAKIFLDASPEVRAARRAAERDAPGRAAERALERRDARDARTVPHVPTPDATVIDATELDAAGVLARALEIVRAAST